MVWVMAGWKAALARLAEVQQSGAHELCARRTGAQTPDCAGLSASIASLVAGIWPSSSRGMCIFRMQTYF